MDGRSISSLLLFAVNLKSHLGLDDSLDFVGIHGVGGILGTVCLGLFALTAVNLGGVDGLFFGNATHLGKQLVGIEVVVVYTFIISWILFKVIYVAMGMRIEEHAEVEGMDSTEHSETAYNN